MVRWSLFIKLSNAAQVSRKARDDGTVAPARDGEIAETREKGQAYSRFRCSGEWKIEIKGNFEIKRALI
jgi:hypothetical protein